MRLDFSDSKYIDAANRVAASSKQGEERQLHSPADAFMLLIKEKTLNDKDNFGDLYNLLKKLNTYYPDLSLEECYELTQGRGQIFEQNGGVVKTVIYNCALSCLENGTTLGVRTTPDGKFNTSDWMSHCLYEAKLSGELASMLHLDSNRATTLALLHDIGRKYSHKFDHVPLGFEALIDVGWENEASAALTHSFIDGGRCANCDPAEEGFYVNQEGEACWESEENKDDITHFLEEYQYNTYDDILNIADLMATSKGIVSPLKRLEDIAQRKTPDPKNRSYFLAKFTNKLNEFLVKMGEIDTYELLNPADDPSKIQEVFQSVSATFYSAYKKQRDELNRNDQ